MRTPKQGTEPVDWRREWMVLVLVAGVFLTAFWFPVGKLGFGGPARESIELVRWYAREHVLLCLVPAFFIAGAIAVFVSQGSVVRYLGAGANKFVAYGVASVSGTILAVCSCTVLPLFAGIYRRGAGLGPATAFLYSGPAINVLAIILTARVLGMEIGVARAVGAVVFSVVIGLLMSRIFRDGASGSGAPVPVDENERPLSRTMLFFAALVGFLVFANWGAPAGSSGWWYAVYSYKWLVTALFAAAIAAMVGAWFSRGEVREWVDASWGFARQILPLLLLGVLIAGALLGRPGSDGLIPSHWVSRLVGGNSLTANLLASIAGAFMYFATLTEVPILQALMGAGMGKGPALALLLAGPALSLPNMLVIRSVMGWRKTVVYILLVVVMATASGFFYGAVFA